MKLPRFGVEEWLNVHEKSASLDLASVSIASLYVEELLQLAQVEPVDFWQDLAKTKLDYGWIEGSPDFKEAVASLYGHQTPANILQTNGATGANMLALYSLIEPGDHVIVLYPTYQQLYDIPKSFGAEVEFWTIQEHQNWLPSLDDLRELMRPNTKMICINNANNPTGAVMDRAYLEELVAIASQSGAYILSDEVYKSFSPELDVPAICDLYDKGISVNSLSKTYSLPGIRVGWVATSQAITDILRDYRDYTMICAGVFDDKVATLALKHRQAILERNAKIVQTNLRILEDWVAIEDQVSLISPAQVSTAFVKLKVSVPIEEFCLALLKETGVLLVPGNRFDIEGHVRLGYACPTATLQAGLAKLSEFLKSYN
ncbi:aminotransferase [Streptococcus caprae]|uniref:Aminotransferase n=1 Tax=Streptococcus caprae TaxID=1640501 RepID=A0ABV8CUL3_9STRE